MYENFEIRNVDNTLIGKTFTNLTIVEPNKYYQKGDTHSRLYVMCKCNCGKTQLFRYDGLIRGRIESCGHCYDNQYIILNDYVTILKVFDRYTEDWVDVLVNTECVDYLKSKSTWYVNISTEPSAYRVIIRGADKLAERTKKASYSHLHRVIVEYINQKYGLPPLQDDMQIDHISGNTFNNLYFPKNDPISKYFNNMRVCTGQQNTLNIPCQGYHVVGNSYRSQLTINGVVYRKTFETPEECIEYDLNMLKEISPENMDYYYLSPTNPRNDPTTFSNTYLKYIGYNDSYRSYFITRDDITPESDDDISIYTNPEDSLNRDILDDD